MIGMNENRLHSWRTKDERVSMGKRSRFIYIENEQAASEHYSRFLVGWISTLVAGGR